MAETMYGYVRVSTREQNEDRQMLAMERFGVERRNIFLDKQSGQDFNRPRYRGLLRRMREGDVLVIKSIDRLGRNYEEILEQWRCITREKKAAIVVLDMPLLDTRQSRSLMGTLIADIVLQLLSYVAQTERELIHQRQAEGIAAAKARGVRFGPPPKARPENYARCLLAWQSGAISAREAARQLQVSHKTFLRWHGNQFCARRQRSILGSSKESNISLDRGRLEAVLDLYCLIIPKANLRSRFIFS